MYHITFALYGMLSMHNVYIMWMYTWLGELSMQWIKESCFWRIIPTVVCITMYITVNIQKCIQPAEFVGLYLSMFVCFNFFIILISQIKILMNTRQKEKTIIW